MGLGQKISHEFSAWNPEEIPSIVDPVWIVLGRSNVGKSSFLNSLTHPSKVFRVGARPGVTQGVIGARVWLGKSPESSFLMLDTPGFGYSQARGEGAGNDKKRWEALLGKIKMQIPEENRLWLWLIGAEKPPGEEEQILKDWIGQDLCQIVFTKSDKFPVKKRPESFSKGWKKFLEIEYSDVLWASSQTAEGVDRVGTIARQFVKSARDLAKKSHLGNKIDS